MIVSANPEREASKTLNVPTYALYGEARKSAIYGFFHIENLSVRNVPNRWRIGSHVHPDFDQLSILFRGQCSYTQDGKTGQAAAPSCVYTPAGVVHHFAYQPNSIGVVISASPNLAFGLSGAESGANLATLGLARRRLTNMDAQTARRVKSLANMLSDRSARPGGHKREIVRHMFAALILEIDSRQVHQSAQLAAQAGSGAAALFQRYFNLVRKEISAIGYADGAKAQAITVEQFAHRLSTTPQAINSASRAISEHGAREIIQEAVSEQARRLLLYTTYSVKEISYLLGYSHASHFVRFFKHSSRMTPLEFRTSFVRDEIA